MLVADPRKLRLIYQNDKKSDRVDAESLARLARVDPHLLAPIHRRSAETQRDLAALRARSALVRARTQLVNHLRGAVKAFGGRLPKCSTPSFHTRAVAHLPAELATALEPLLRMLAELTTELRAWDKRITREMIPAYPDTARLAQVPGVGPITALTYRLTIEDPQRFATSRIVGSYLGLRPRRAAAPPGSKTDSSASRKEGTATSADCSSDVPSTSSGRSVPTRIFVAGVWPRRYVEAKAQRNGPSSRSPASSPSCSTDCG